ncbi:MAG: ATP-binding cassette domain-containing protein [Deltaproteobacteria bacterium]|nr:ATP-binding cassette domain-containing protein [Deltaproteobacteria bacterium]
MELLRAEGVYKSYGGGTKVVEVLKGVDFSLEKGETIAILGASGAGKSTLLHIMGGLDKPTAGKVIYDGEPIFGRSERMLASFRNRSVGFVFQFHHLLPEFTALENAMMPVLLGGEGKGEAERKAADLLEEVGLGHRLEHKPGELSGGEQQRLAIARALIQTPPLLLADEPTGNLDTHTGDDVFNLLLRMNRDRGVTIVLVTHNKTLADRVGRRLTMIDGRLHEEGSGN